jgi:hypothetical protein
MQCIYTYLHVDEEQENDELNTWPRRGQMLSSVAGACLIARLIMPGTAFGAVRVRLRASVHATIYVRALTTSLPDRWHAWNAFEL